MATSVTRHISGGGVELRIVNEREGTTLVIPMGKVSIKEVNLGSNLNESLILNGIGFMQGGRAVGVHIKIDYLG